MFTIYISTGSGFCVLFIKKLVMGSWRWISQSFQCRLQQRSPFYAEPDELLKYTNGKIPLVLDICGRRFAREDFDKIGEEHPDAKARIKVIESYRFNL